MQKTKPSPATALIAHAKAQSTRQVLSPEGVEALRQLFAYNDALPVNSTCRVSSEAASKMLRENYGYKAVSHHTLSTLCRALGRVSWSKP